MQLQVKLLIVDDEPVILKTLTLLFASRGLNVHSTTDPHQAIKLMEDELFHLVLSDIRMPQMTGNELLKHIKRINPLCQVIMMTGYSSLDYVVECIGHGACDYFLKPFADIQLLQKSVLDTSERIIRWHQVMHDTFERG